MMGDFTIMENQLNIFGWYFTPLWVMILMLTWEFFKNFKDYVMIQ